MIHTRATIDGLVATSSDTVEFDSNGCQWILTGLDGWFGGVGVRGSAIDRPMVDGSFDGPAPFESRTVILEGTVIAPTEADLSVAMDSVANVWASATGRTGVLQVNELDRGWLGRRQTPAACRLGGPTMVKRISKLAAEWSVNVFSPDPRRVSMDAFSAVVYRFIPGGGRSYSFTPDRVYSGVGTSGTATLDSNGRGNTTAYPVIDFSGPIVNPTIIINGVTLGMTISLDAAQSVTIDTYARTVIQDGAYSRRALLTPDSRFPVITPSTDTSMQFFADSGTGFARVTYRAAWS